MDSILDPHPDAIVTKSNFGVQTDCGMIAGQVPYIYTEGYYINM